MAPSSVVTIPIEKGKGPARWDLLLSIFDPLPAGAGPPRHLEFTLATGGVLKMEMTGHDKPRYGLEGPWKIRGPLVARLKPGYAPIGDPENSIEVTFDPADRAGSVDLRLVPACHPGVGMNYEMQAGFEVGRCQSCNQTLTRVNPFTGTLEWLDGYPWDHPDHLRSVVGGQSSGWGYSEEAWKAVALAQDNATLRGERFWNSWDLLLALWQGRGLASQALERKGVTRYDLLNHAKADLVCVEVGEDVLVLPACLQIFEHARHEALHVSANEIGDDHLLLALAPPHNRSVTDYLASKCVGTGSFDEELNRLRAAAKHK